MDDVCIQNDNSKNKKVRNLQFDFTRSLCVLWIVCFWHVLYYLPEKYQVSDSNIEYFRNFTNAVLATFTFLSGFFLQKYKFNGIADILGFYKKRLLRFYPLYAISIISWGAMSHIGMRTIVDSLLGYSMFTTPMPTLWYFSMMITFYLFTPCFKFDSSYGLIKNSLIGGGIICLTIIAFKYADIRYLTFLPFYVIGINVPKNYLINKLKSKKTCIVVLVAAIVLFALALHLHSGIKLSLLADYLVSITGLLVIVTLTYLTCPYKLSGFIQYVAFSSMCAYLFHRQFYGIVLVISRIVLKESSIPLIMAIGSMLLIFSTSHLIQNIYNKLIKQ